MAEINYFATNLKFLRQRKNMEQLELAHLLKRKSSSSISEWEKGKYQPKSGILSDIASIFNVSLSDLMETDLTSGINAHIKLTASPFQNTSTQTTDKVVYLDKELKDPRHSQWISNGEQLLEEQLDEREKVTMEIQEEVAGYNSDKIIAFPDKEESEYDTFSLRGLGSAGDGILQEDDEDIEVRLPLNEVPDDFDDLVLVIGDSMRPKLHNGDILFIQHTKQIEIGQIGIFRTNKGNFIKRFQQDRLESLNPDYEDVYFAEDEYAEIVGVVIDYYRK